MRKKCTCKILFKEELGTTVSNVKCKDIKKQMLHEGRKLYFLDGKEINIDGRVRFMAEKIQICHDIQRRMIEQGISGEEYINFTNVKEEIN